MTKAENRCKRRIGIALVVVAVITVVAVIAAITVPRALEKRYQEQKQIACQVVLYCQAFGMEHVAVPEFETYSIFSLLEWDYFPMLFLEVEYVMEFPPEDERRWATVYLKPDSGYFDSTQWAVDELNKFIESDPGIVVNTSLALPLTKEQVVSSPDAVLNVIKQLDAEQWRRLYIGWYPWIINDLANGAGIEVPEGFVDDAD
jgi:hypothetical protein